MALLEVDDIHTFYGNIEALKGISLTVDEGEIVTLIGSNGAGKSTTLRSISGLTAAARGLDPLRRQGDRRDRAAGHRPARHLPVPRGPALLPAHDRAGEPRARAPTCAATAKSSRTSTACSSCSRGSRSARRQKAGTMSGGEQQMLAIGRALMAEPEAAAAGRALDGHRADPRGADLRDDRRDQPAGHHDPAGGAERQLRAGRLQARLRAGDRHRRAHRRVRRRCATTPRSRRRTWAHDRSSPPWAPRPSTCSTRGSRRLHRRPPTSRTGRATARRPGSPPGSC